MSEVFSDADREHLTIPFIDPPRNREDGLFNHVNMTLRHLITGDFRNCQYWLSDLIDRLSSESEYVMKAKAKTAAYSRNQLVQIAPYREGDSVSIDQRSLTVEMLDRLAFSPVEDTMTIYYVMKQKGDRYYVSVLVSLADGNVIKSEIIPT